MSKRSNGFDRRERDFYPTPRAAVLPLIMHLRAARIRTFCEPCAGDGALVRHLETFGLVCARANDIATGTDARDIQNFYSPVITNPPYERQLEVIRQWHQRAKEWHQTAKNVGLGHAVSQPRPTPQP